MDNAFLSFRQTLKTSGYSLTRPRQAIFRILEDSEPMTVAEIFQACHATIDRVTVYRVIELFEQLQIIQKINLGWKYKIELKSPYQVHHHHLTCTRCHKISALPEDAILETRLKLLATSGKFIALDHQIEIRGICQVCARL